MTLASGQGCLFFAEKSAKAGQCQSANGWFSGSPPTERVAVWNGRRSNSKLPFFSSASANAQVQPALSDAKAAPPMRRAGLFLPIRGKRIGVAAERGVGRKSGGVTGLACNAPLCGNSGSTPSTIRFPLGGTAALVRLPRRKRPGAPRHFPWRERAGPCPRPPPHRISLVRSIGFRLWNAQDVALASGLRHAWQQAPIISSRSLGTRLEREAWHKYWRRLHDLSSSVGNVALKVSAAFCPVWDEFLNPESAKERKNPADVTQTRDNHVIVGRRRLPLASLRSTSLTGAKK
jgi:hypothetical protein